MASLQRCQDLLVTCVGHAAGGVCIFLQFRNASVVMIRSNAWSLSWEVKGERSYIRCTGGSKYIAPTPWRRYCGERRTVCFVPRALREDTFCWSERYSSMSLSACTVREDGKLGELVFRPPESTPVKDFKEHAQV